jgi:CubicO group peptidase (beta-lactamase class C family)
MSFSVADVNQRLSTGMVSPGFEAVRNQLDAYLLADPAYSAQLSVYWNGEPVVDLVGGPDLAEDSVTGVFSVSKGVSALVIATLVRDGLLDLDEPVARYWPEFAAAGKAAITVRQLLSHQAGLVGLPGGIRFEEFRDSAVAAARLAEAFPDWRPGSAFGYHGLTIGVFMEELTRRITGRSLQEIYESEIRAPHDIDFYLGFPAESEHRFREVLPMAPTSEQQAEIDRRASAPDGITALAFNSAVRGPSVVDSPTSPNVREVRAAGPAAVGGIGSARGLAKAYATAIGAAGAPALLDPGTVAKMTQQQVCGVDRVLNKVMCFGIVYMKPHQEVEFGSYRAFGHDGAGGALAFADPTYGIGFGYIPMPIQYPGAADPKGVQLSTLVRSCIRLRS